MHSIHITETIKLNCCWICSSKSSLEEHHIVPEAYGGQNSPLVTLCAICHNAIHAVSYKHVDLTGSDLCELCNHWCSDSNAVKATYLINIIRKARLLTKNDSNKNVKISYTLNAETARKLKYLSKQLGITQQVAIGVAINNLHDKLFGTKHARG